MLRSTLLVLLLNPVLLFGGERKDSALSHHGFHLELSAGPAWSGIHDDVKSDVGPMEHDFKGMGLAWKFAVGHSIVRDVILTAEISSIIIYHPELTSSQEIYLSSMQYHTHENMLAAGITWYRLPAGLFAGCSIGIGEFQFRDGNSSVFGDAKAGSSMELRLGKHWWLSEKWGLACSAVYGRTAANSDEISTCLTGGYGYDHLRSSRLAIQVGLGFR